jgi:hypothetical protein
MQGCDLLKKYGFGARDVLDRLAGNRIGQKADEIAGMPRIQGDPDLAVGLEAGDAGTMACARIDDDEWAAARIDGDAFRRNDAHKPIVNRALQRSRVEYEFRVVAQHMWRGFGQMLSILIAALTHDIPEQHRALGRVDRVVHRRPDEADHLRRHLRLLCRRLIAAH